MLVLSLSKVFVDDIPDITITRVDIRAVDRSTSTVIFTVSVSRQCVGEEVHVYIVMYV